MLFKKVFVIVVSAILALPVAGQQADPIIPSAPSHAYGPVVRTARLAQASTPQPGQSAVPAQAAVTETPAPAAEPPGILEVVVVEGDGGTNDIAVGTAITPKVRVLDDKGNPAPGAEVVFALPMGGPSGVFNGWVRSQTVRAGEDGLAAASGLTPNEIEGRFNIKVTATSGNRKGTAVIGVTNIKGAKKKSSKKHWIIMGAAAAAVAVVIAVAATGDDNNSVTKQPVVISPGGVTVGGPK